MSESYSFGPTERPMMPGGPYMPAQPAGRKAAYAATALSLAMFGTFGNSLLTNNVSYVAGAFGLTSAEASWFSVAYLSMGASANLFVIKARVQFGISRILKCGLGAYAIAALLAAAFPSFWTEVAARAANGFITSTGVAMAIYYLLEVLPPKARPAAVPIVLGAVQMATPLARLVPVDIVIAHHNRGLNLIAAAIALCQIGLVLTWPLPPTPTSKAFERRDALTAALVLPALVLMVGVLGLGRAHWWTDTPWLGSMLIAAVVLLAVGLGHEWQRPQPLLALPWMSRTEILRFVGIALIERITLAEQSFGVVGLLSAAGLNSDQFHGLFLLVAVAEGCGIVLAVVTLSEKAIPYQVIAALLLIGAASWSDSYSNGLTRMPQFYASQAMVGLGTTLFVGPALLYGLLRVMRTGPQYLISMVMLFSFTQNVGSLAGSALLSSYQFISQSVHVANLTGQLDASNAALTGRLAATGPAGIANAVMSQGALLGYLDVFRLVGLLCLLTIIATLIALLRSNRVAREAHS